MGTGSTWHSVPSCRTSASLSSPASLKTDRNTPSICSSSWIWKLCPRSSLTSWSGRPRPRNRPELLRRGRDLLRSRRDRGGWRSSELGRSSSRETDSKRFPGTRRPQTSTEWLLDNNSSSSQLLSSTHNNNHRDQTLTPGGDNPSSSLSSSSNVRGSSHANSCRLRTSFLWETHSSLSSHSRKGDILPKLKLRSKKLSDCRTVLPIPPSAHKTPSEIINCK